MKNFLQELRRRKVPQVMLAYGGIAWIVIQFCGTVLPAYGAPTWLLRLVFAVAVLGAIPTLLVAWFYRLTSSGLQQDDLSVAAPPKPRLLSGRQVDFVVIGILVTALLCSLFLRTPAIDLYQANESLDARQSVAVLPFANVSGDPNNEYFSDGLSEALLNRIGQIKGLKVPSRTSAFVYKTKRADARDIAKALKVNNLLEGSVQREGDRVRINAQLVDGRDGSSVWSKQFDRQVADIFSVQDEISASVAKALRTQLIGSGGALGASSTIGTRNLQALEAYWRGLQAFNSRTRESMYVAEKEFRRAAEVDPEFAEAEAGIARAVLELMARYGEGNPPEVVARAEEHADRALSLNENLVEAQEARAEILVVKGLPTRMRNWYGQAQIALSRAIKINPNRASTYAIAAEAASRNRDTPGAVRAFERAIELDPLAAGLRVDYARKLGRAGKNKEAEQQLLLAIQTDLDYADSHYAAAELYGNYIGRLDQAARHARQARRMDPGSPLYAMMLIMTLTDLGELDEALAVARDTQSIGSGNPFWLRAVVWMHTRRGDWQAARRELDAHRRKSETSKSEVRGMVDLQIMASGGDPTELARVYQNVKTDWPALFGEDPKISSAEEAQVFPDVFHLAALNKDASVTGKLAEMIRPMLPAEADIDDAINAGGFAGLTTAYALLGDHGMTWKILKSGFADPPEPSTGWWILKRSAISPATELLSGKPDFDRLLRTLEEKTAIQLANYQAQPDLPPAAKLETANP